MNNTTRTIALVLPLDTAATSVKIATTNLAAEMNLDVQASCGSFCRDSYSFYVTFTNVCDAKIDAFSFKLLDTVSILDFVSAA